MASPKVFSRESFFKISAVSGAPAGISVAKLLGFGGFVPFTISAIIFMVVVKILIDACSSKPRLQNFVSGVLLLVCIVIAVLFHNGLQRAADTAADASPASTAKSAVAERGPWEQYTKQSPQPVGTVGNELRCTQWSSQTGQCSDVASPPSGYTWDTAPTQAQVLAKSSPAWTGLVMAAIDRGAAKLAAQWNSDTATFYQQHPSLSYQKNAALMQEKLSNGGAAGMAAGLTNTQVLNNALAAAQADSRWQLPPASAPTFDQAAKKARWKTAVAMLFQEHPALSFQHNANILQEKLNAVDVAGMTDQQMLDKAYTETVSDHRWVSVP